MTGFIGSGFRVFLGGFTVVEAVNVRLLHPTIARQILAPFLPIRCFLALRMQRSALIRAILFCKPEHLTCTEIARVASRPSFDEVVSDRDGAWYAEFFAFFC